MWEGQKGPMPKIFCFCFKYYFIMGKTLKMGQTIFLKKSKLDWTWTVYENEVSDTGSVESRIVNICKWIMIIL